MRYGDSATRILIVRLAVLSELGHPHPVLEVTDLRYCIVRQQEIVRLVAQRAQGDECKPVILGRRRL